MSSRGRSRSRRRAWRRAWRRFKHSKWSTVALVALAVLAVGLSIFAIVRVPSGTEQADANARDVHYTPPAQTHEPETKLIGFLGDSWSCGGGLPLNYGPEGSYAAQAADLLGWKHTIDCAGGTGYTTDTQAGTDYLSRLPALVKADPDVVVIQGSTNDYRATEAEIQGAAARVVSRVQAELPDAQVFLLGPAYTPDAPKALVDPAREALSKVAAAHHVAWIDLAQRGWLNQATDFADGYHPNKVGHRLLAVDLARVLRAQVTSTTESAP